MELIPLCTLDATIGGMHLIGTGPAGARTIAEVSGGSVTGERLNGAVRQRRCRLDANQQGRDRLA